MDAEKSTQSIANVSFVVPVAGYANPSNVPTLILPPLLLRVSSTRVGLEGRTQDGLDSLRKNLNRRTLGNITSKKFK